MKLDFASVGFGAVAVTGVVLALIGHPQPSSSPSEAATRPPVFVFKSVSVELPGGTPAFPAHAGVETITANCLACHSADMVLAQPKLPAAAWDAIVGKMIHTYKAPITDADAKVIDAYLQSGL